MKKKTVSRILVTVAALAMLTAMLGGCSGKGANTVTSEPVVVLEPQSENNPGAASEPAPEVEDATKSGRADGERFDDTIIMEGMEETVHYEHAISFPVGVELDYDYESFKRNTEPERIAFVSLYDDEEKPENYLEITFSTESAESVIASESEALSKDYELLTSERELTNAGTCTRIEASVIKGTNDMADQIVVVYVIPAEDGCRIAKAHYAIEAAEGFGRRFNYMLDTLYVLKRS
ncbi:MAG: hypothetical protein IKP92_04985 [Lachnospiraceae bacterium]|nr:hypothetical protein [Lachnospiraceae bacterium]